MTIKLFEICKKILLMSLGIFLSLIVIESVLQTFSAVYSFKKSHGNKISMSKKTAYKILCLGESTTDGQYPWHLEEVLNAKDIGVKFAIIDKGRGGTVTETILEHLNKYLDEFNPDMVVTMVGINDDRRDLVAFELKSGHWYSALKSLKLVRLLKIHIEAKLLDLNGGRVKASNNNQKDKKSAAIFLKAIEINPKNEEAYARLGNLYKEQKRYRKAETMFLKAIEINPKNEETYIGIGRLYGAQKKYSEAQAIFLKAIEINPKNEKPYAGIGRLYGAQKKYKQAEAMFLKAIEIAPKNDWTYEEIAGFYKWQRKFKEPEVMFLKVIDINPLNDSAYARLGDMYRKQKKYREAEAMFLKAIEINPKNKETYAGIERLYRRQKKYKEAEAVFQKAIKGPLNSDSREFDKMSVRYLNKYEANKNKYYGKKTQYNYRKLHRELEKRNIQLVCVQYPTLEIQPLKDILEPNDGIVFVDNENSFKDAVRREGYDAYFTDKFAYKYGFGHCTYKGNRLLAENIAGEIVKECFQRQNMKVLLVIKILNI